MAAFSMFIVLVLFALLAGGVLCGIASLIGLILVTRKKHAGKKYRTPVIVICSVVLGFSVLAILIPVVFFVFAAIG